jgi:hypothetical protein
MDRAGQGNLIRCTPVLDERVRTAGLLAVTAKRRRQTEYSLRKPSIARAQGTVIPHSPSLSRLDPWSWESTFPLGTGGLGQWGNVYG